MMKGWSSSRPMRALSSIKLHEGACPHQSGVQRDAVAKATRGCCQHGKHSCILVRNLPTKPARDGLELEKERS